METTMITNENAEELLKKVITETLNVYLEWLRTETIIVDVDTKEPILNAELTTIENPKSLFKAVCERLKEKEVLKLTKLKTK